MKADIVICGGGIAGISAAYHLSKIPGKYRIIIVDDLPPLSLTSDKSTECYRNWWYGPDHAMVSLMNRSIEIMDTIAAQTNNSFNMNRRGYVYFTGNQDHQETFIEQANIPPSFGAGDLRIVNSVISSSSQYSTREANDLDGADLLIGNDVIHNYFPFITKGAIAALHVRKAGWFSAQQLGTYLFNQAISNGVRFYPGHVQDIQLKGGSIHSICLNDGIEIETGIFVNAAGPFINTLSQMLGTHLPIINELHLKAVIKDSLAIIPRDAPLLIWSDRQIIDWEPEIEDWFLEDAEYSYLLHKLPGGAHTRPEGGPDSDIVLMLWEYQTRQETPTLHPEFDPMYPETVLRGLSKLIPDLAKYRDNLPKPILDGGYYTKAPDNRPIIGPGPIPGYYLIGALSGFGLMSSCAAGELLAAHISGVSPPEYAKAFHLSRFNDEEYLAKFDGSIVDGQL